MNIALITGRAGSVGVKRKNVIDICGRPLCTYPMRAALRARLLDRIYVATDCETIMSLSAAHGLGVIELPQPLVTAEAQLHDTIAYSLDRIHALVGQIPDILVTMHANCGIHRDGLIDECISTLIDDEALDSCVSARRVVDLHPYRQKRVRDDGRLEPWITVPGKVTNNRQSIQSTSVFLDGACRAFRPRCLDSEGQPPFRYLGDNIAWVENPRGLDVHSEDDVAAIRAYWARQGDPFAVAIS